MKNDILKILDEIKIHNNLVEEHHIEIAKKSLSFGNFLTKKIKKGSKLFLAGNGGSAADAQHIATELTVRMSYNRKAIPAIALTTDTSALTAIGNDLSFDQIFKRQIEALVQKKDVIMLISTSGNSKNILEALKYAKKNNLYTFGLLGNRGGRSKKYFDDYFIVNSSNPSRTQEIHLLFYHALCSVVEKNFLR